MTSAFYFISDTEGLSFIFNLFFECRRDGGSELENVERCIELLREIKEFICPQISDSIVPWSEVFQEGVDQPRASRIYVLRRKLNEVARYIDEIDADFRQQNIEPNIESMNDLYRELDLNLELDI